MKQKNDAKQREIYFIIKRLLDILIASLGIVLLIPTFIIISIFIKLEVKGPVLFFHTRVGKNGKKFKLWKFRTMVLNAEEQIKQFSTEQQTQFYQHFKLKDDPRVTKTGRILRNMNLDELPQLVNVIKGDLSLVGPRPIVDEELKKYKENKEKLLSVTPGLTGYWVANRKENTSYEERIKMELYYIDHMSLKLDMIIFFKTIVGILKNI